MPETKSYAVELHNRLPVYIQHGEKFDINGMVFIIDHDCDKVWMLDPNDIKSIKEGVFNEQ